MMDLLVFTDLDGTLLDHSTYSFDAARPALTALKDRDVPVILASSKTAAEIAPLHAVMELGDAPAIVENGAATFVPGHTDHEDRSDYHRLRQALYDVPPPLRACFQGFGDMAADDVMAATGLTAPEARRAQARQSSEPGLWSGTEEALRDFTAALAELGITARKGGRFLTLSFGDTKARQMDALISRYAPLRSVALGDAPNDVEMLQHADIGVIVANPHGPGIPTLAGEQTGQIRRTGESGPKGWNRAILDILHEMTHSGDRT